MSEFPRRSRTDWAAFGRYFCLLYIRADREIRARFRRKAWEVTKAFVGFLVGLLLVGVLLGWGPLMDRLTVALVAGFGAALIVWIGEAVWDCIRAPYLIHQDGIAKRKEALGQRREFQNQLHPTLKIIFEKSEHPFFQTSPNNEMSYRVGVVSSILVNDAVLTANALVGGVLRTNAHLLSDQDDGLQRLKRVKLYPGKPDYWQVVTKGSPGTQDVHLQHIERYAKNLSLPLEFEITATGGDSWPVKKIAKVYLDDEKLVLELQDPIVVP